MRELLGLENKEVIVMRLANFVNAKKLKKQLLKKGAALGVMSLLAVACSGTTVLAENPARGNLDGFACYGKVSTDKDSATAMTTCGRGSITIKATATVFYWYGDFYYYSTMTYSNTNSSATAIAKKKKGGAQVVAGMGEHFVSFNSHQWSGTTITGTIPTISTKL